EELVERCAELRLDHADDLVERCRANRILQLGELGDDVGGKQVGASGENLAELDEGRTELLQRHSQAHGAALCTAGSVGLVVEQASIADALEQPELVWVELRDQLAEPVR